jgi:hypothetical protein
MSVVFVGDRIRSLRGTRSRETICRDANIDPTTLRRAELMGRITLLTAKGPGVQGRRAGAAGRPGRMARCAAEAEGGQVAMARKKVAEAPASKEAELARWMRLHAMSLESGAVTRKERELAELILRQPITDPSRRFHAALRHWEDRRDRRDKFACAALTGLLASGAQSAEGYSSCVMVARELAEKMVEWSDIE